MDQLALSFRATEESPGTEPEPERQPDPEPEATWAPEPATTYAQTPAPAPGPGTPRAITSLAEINSSTGPVELCSLDGCDEHAARWVVFDHAAVFTAFCSEYAPESPWWTPTGPRQN